MKTQTNELQNKELKQLKEKDHLLSNQLLEEQEEMLENIYMYFFENLKNSKNEFTKGNLYFSMGSGRVTNSKYFLIENDNPKYKNDSNGFLEISTKNESKYSIVINNDEIGFYSNNLDRPLFFIPINILEQFENFNISNRLESKTTQLKKLIENKVLELKIFINETIQMKDECINLLNNELSDEIRTKLLTKIKKLDEIINETNKNYKQLINL